MQASLLNDKDGTQEEACTSSGGACEHSFSLENLRQQQDKNTATLGTTTAWPEKGARRKRKKKKPSAIAASQDPSDQGSFEQKGQQPAASQLRNLEKLSLIKEIELAAEKTNQLKQQRAPGDQLEDLTDLKLETKMAAHNDKSNDSLLRRCFRKTT